MPSNYIVCAIARSGSNYLCELLSSLGYAGRSFEHLWDPPGREPEPLATRWSRVLQEGTSENGVFGTKILWYQMKRLEEELPAALARPHEPLVRVLAVTLADPEYIYLTRRDQLRQAISFARALQTKQWRSMDVIAAEPHYDADAVTEGLRQVEREEMYWEDFFVRSGISPYRVFYEELEMDAEGVVGRIMANLGYRDGSPIPLSLTRHRRQADALTEEWMQRYLRETVGDRLPYFPR